MSPSVHHPVIKFLLLIVLFSTFLTGFFPSSPAIGVPETRTTPRQPGSWTRRVGPLVIMVIDALRADFVLDVDTGPGSGSGKKIRYLQELLQNQTEAVGFVTRASPPTVTLPRIKVKVTNKFLLIKLSLNVYLGNNDWESPWLH